MRFWVSRLIGAPRTRICPSSGAVMSMIIRIVVVFPAPLGPSRPNTVPRGTWNESESTAWNLPKDFETFVSSIAVSIGLCPCYLRIGKARVAVSPLDLISRFRLRFAFRAGEVLEWLIRPVSKTGKPQKGFVGSNPTLSARVFSPSGQEEQSKHRGALVPQQTSLDGAAVVQTRVARDVAECAAVAGLGVRAAEDDAGDARVDGRPGAHRAGLDGGIERRALQPPGPR